jgi:hypothetical protein
VGNFSPITLSGTGNQVVTLPSEIRAGVVEATYVGTSNFIVHSLDASLSRDDLVVNVIGDYVGGGGFGFKSYSSPAAGFEVMATGSWTLTVKPISTMPTLPESGSGSGVYRVQLAAVPIWKSVYVGSSNFIVWQYCTNTSDTKLVANTIGDSKSSSVGMAGDCILEVMSSGTWSIAPTYLTISRAAIPVVTGTLKIGKTLSVSRGTWMSGVSFRYQWLRNGAPISGATKTTYKLTKSDKGRKISVRVSGSRTGYSSVSKVSAAKKVP